MLARWLERRPNATIEAAELLAEGIPCQRLPLEPAHHEAPLTAVARENGYVTQDTVELAPSTPNLQTICDKYAKEHHHDEDEVRFVLSGGGYFDIRSRSDEWMRVEVEPGDLIVVPKGRHHRFLLTDERAIQCVRLFQDASGWTPHYREAPAGTGEGRDG